MGSASSCWDGEADSPPLFGLDSASVGIEQRFRVKDLIEEIVISPKAPPNRSRSTEGYNTATGVWTYYGKLISAAKPACGVRDSAEPVTHGSRRATGEPGYSARDQRDHKVGRHPLLSCAVAAKIYGVQPNLADS